MGGGGNVRVESNTGTLGLGLDDRLILLKHAATKLIVFVSYCLNFQKINVFLMV